MLVGLERTIVGAGVGGRRKVALPGEEHRGSTTTALCQIVSFLGLCEQPSQGGSIFLATAKV